MNYIDKSFYQKLLELQNTYPQQYAMSGLCEITVTMQDIGNPKYTVTLPTFEIGKKQDDGNANTRDRYMGILLKEFTNPIEKTENYRILYNKIYLEYGRQMAHNFLKNDVLGSMYFHNSTNIVTKPYCFAYDFDQLVEKGAFFTDISDRPAKHLDSFIQHIIEFVAVTCRETTGAVGMPALFPYMWYLWDQDIKSGYTKNPQKYLEQNIQMLVYKLNGSEMRMNESAFTNVSCMDESYINNFFGDRLFPNGEPIIKYTSEIVDLECFFLQCVNDILEHKVMTFPVITDCILFDNNTQQFVNPETARRFSDLNQKWNNANMYCGTDISTLSTCCRVLNNVDAMNTKLSGFANFIGGSDLNIGSIGVVTLNLPNWAYKMIETGSNIESSLTYLKHRITKGCKYLHCIRSCFQDLIDRKALKIYDLSIAKIERQFNTIGFIGLYDAARIFDIDNILDFERKILEIFDEVTKEFAQDKPYSINIEQIPGESACVKLAKKDKITFGEDVVITDCYSNQWVPLNEYMSINDRSEYAAVLDKLCGGGSILHLNIDTPFTNSEQGWKLLNDIAKKGVIYFAFNNRISVDEHEHGFYGDTCWCGSPKIGEATRPVGFITLIKNWIPSRKDEYKERKWITL